MYLLEDGILCNARGMNRLHYRATTARLSLIFLDVFPEYFPATYAAYMSLTLIFVSNNRKDSLQF